MSDLRKVLTNALALATGFVLGVTAIHVVKATRKSKQKSPPTTSQNRLLQAIHFSSGKHQDQRRKNPKQTPYINHPISVAHRLLNASIVDDDILIAAVLHDTVEDTDTTCEEISAIFGWKVASIVDEVTDDKSLPKDERKRLQIEHAAHISQEAKLVKLADKLDNLTDLLEITPVGWTPERVTQYFDWAAKVVDPMRGTNSLLETELDAVFSQSQMAADAAAAQLAATEKGTL